MFKADLRQGVVNSQYEETEEFRDWTSSVLQGECRLVHKFSGYHVCFDHEEDLIAYMLTWTEPFQLPKVIIPTIRRVMPTVIVNDILGVSPMSPPSLNPPRILNPKIYK